MKQVPASKPNLFSNLYISYSYASQCVSFISISPLYEYQYLTLINPDYNSAFSAVQLKSYLFKLN